MSDPDTLQPLLDRLAAALAPRLAAELAARQPPSAEALPSRLLSLDELIDRLPRSKKPQTWKRWLYERTRRGAIPGCHKLGGRLYFDPDTLDGWLTANPQAPPPAERKSTG